MRKKKRYKVMKPIRNKKFLFLKAHKLFQLKRITL